MLEIQRFVVRKMLEIQGNSAVLIEKFWKFSIVVRKTLEKNRRKSRGNLGKTCVKTVGTAGIKKLDVLGGQPGQHLNNTVIIIVMVIKKIK